MNRPSHIWLAAIVLIGYTAIAPSQEDGTQPLRLVQTISLPNVKGRLDHMDVDVMGKRLFVAAVENGTVEVVDLEAGKWAHSIHGFKKPQGALYVAELGKLFVASGDDGMLRVFRGDTLDLLDPIQLESGPNRVIYDLIRSLSMSDMGARTQERTMERSESSTRKMTSTSAILKLGLILLSFCWTDREQRFLCASPLLTKSR